MTIWARRSVSAEFTKEELEILIDASLNGDSKVVDKACELLKRKYGGEGYISGEEIAYQAYEMEPDNEKYKYVTGFCDIEW